MAKIQEGLPHPILETPQVLQNERLIYSHLLKYLDIGKINTWSMNEKSAWKMHYMALNVIGRCFEHLSNKEQYVFAHRVKKFIAYIDSKTLPVTVKSFYSSPNLKITRNMIETLCDERMINIYEIKNPDLPQESKHKKANALFICVTFVYEEPFLHIILLANQSIVVSSFLAPQFHHLESTSDCHHLSNQIVL